MDKPSPYERLGIVEPKDVLPFIKPRIKQAPRIERCFLGEPIYIDSPRYLTFRHKGVKCVRCGLEGLYFAIERHKINNSANPERYHLNLYGRAPKSGDEVMLTIDHIVPDSRGGARELENLQPMCSLCNSRKKNMPDHIDAALPVGLSEQDIREALFDDPKSIRIAISLLPITMAGTLYLQMQKEKAKASIWKRMWRAIRRGKQ